MCLNPTAQKCNGVLGATFPSPAAFGNYQLFRYGGLYQHIIDHNLRNYVDQQNKYVFYLPDMLRIMCREREAENAVYCFRSLPV